MFDSHSRCSALILEERTRFALSFSRRSSTAAAAAATSVDPTPSSSSAAAKSLSDIPGPLCLPVIGTAWQFIPAIGPELDLTKMHEKFMRDLEKYGPIFKMKVPGLSTFVILSEPEDIETMRWLEEKYPTRQILSPIKHYRLHNRKLPHEGVLILNGEDWYRLRTKYQQRLMKPKSALLYLDSMQAVASDFVDRIRLIRDAKNEAPNDFQNEFYKWALESVSCMALNTRLGCLDPNLTPDSDAQRMITATNDTFDALKVTENNLPLWKIWPTAAFKRLVAAQDIFTDTSLKYIRRALDGLSAQTPDGPDEADNDSRSVSVLEMLLTKDGLTQDDVLLLILDLLMAGIDTTSHSMGFLLYQLAKNPDKQAKLREEVDRVVGDKAKPVTAKALNELSYLKACIKESMRMQPVTSGVLREFGKDVVIRGHLLPKGTWVFGFSYAACQNPKYFSEPKKFKPERWMRGDSKENVHPYAAMPFGYGSRMCLGKRFAEQEMWLLTTKLMQNFEIRYNYEDIGIETRLLNIPDKPLRFQFLDR